MTRRDFIKKGVLTFAGTALGKESFDTSFAENTQVNMQYRTLGRTGLRVSEIGFGGYPINNPDVIRYALDKGINYFDTAPCYRGGSSEEVLGQGLKGKRDRVVLTSKWCPYHFGKPATKKNFIDMLDASLLRLKTDYVDVLLNHQVGQNSDGLGLERLKNPEIYEAWEEVKQAGKARFFGVSGHDGDLSEVMNWVVDSGHFDVMLGRYNYLDYPDQDILFKKAKDKGLGVIAMKTLAGAKGADITSFRDQYTSFKQAALKWVLSNRNISNLIISISSLKQVDEYVQASGKTLEKQDLAVLDDYMQQFSNEVCRYCNRCQEACPESKKIADILRYSMYFNEYHQEKRALLAYEKLGQNAHGCQTCDAPCEKECPYDLPIKQLLVRADRNLSHHDNS